MEGAHQEDEGLASAELATMTSKEYLDWCSWITRDSVAPLTGVPKEPFEL